MQFVLSTGENINKVLPSSNVLSMTALKNKIQTNQPIPVLGNMIKVNITNKMTA